MKYINKKLPLIEVGKEIEWYEDLTMQGVHAYPEGILHCSSKILASLIEDEWIEEVKPREFYIPVHRDTGKLLASDRPMDKGYSGGWTLAVEVIKVREIL